MSSVELPQVSFQRYLELVRRRRWQLLPISAFGLLVGAIVAFLIPRYYVAETMIERTLVVGEFPDNDEDPGRSVVQSAKATLPWVVGKALERLRWPEWLAADASQRTQLEKEIRSRVVPEDFNALEPRRSYALIRVTYKDRNAAHAADLLNALVQTWIEDSLATLRRGHEDQRQRASQEHAAWTERYEQLLKQESDIMQQFRIPARLDTTTANLEDSKRRETLEALRQQWLTKDSERQVLADSVHNQQRALQALPDRLPLTEVNLLITATAMVNANERSKEVLLHIKAWSDLKSWVARLPEQSRRRAPAERELAQAQRLLLLELGIELDERQQMPNREFVIASKRLEEDRKTLARLEYETKRLADVLAADREVAERMPEGLRLLKSVQKSRDQAASMVEEKFKRQQEQENILRGLEVRRPVQQRQPAQAPPHPTDPNVFVVAFIGAVLGLGIAIGLILLLDMLQGSFKTPDDVERGLGVPVLGAMSHLETEQERETTMRGRRRAAVTAFAFVALLTVVVAFYFLAPTRLPDVVRTVLKSLLGS